MPPPFLHEHQRAMNQLFTSTSRVLAALLFVALTTESAAQSFPLPYNPDENGDGLIGVVDLQGLLSNYGSEFSGAVISEDGESAITYMGDMAYPLCALSCENLPGMWHMATMTELAMVWDHVYTTNEVTITWVGNQEKRDFSDTNEFLYFESNNGTGVANHNLGATRRPGSNWSCYCAARQLPRVEYTTCGYYSNGSYAVPGGTSDCAAELVAAGWYPLGGISSANYTGGQAFWRWAE